MARKKSRKEKRLEKQPYVPIQYEANKIFLVAGCPRSGTRYISRVLKKRGLDVGHETIQKNGISSWRVRFPNKEVALQAGRTYRQGIPYKDFYLILHQVRHPLHNINSLHAIGSWGDIEESIPCPVRDPKLLRAMKCWYYWNLELGKIAHLTYRVEDIDNVFDQICKLIGVGSNKEVLKQIPKDDHSRKHRPKYGQATWEDMKNIDKALCDNIISLARQYGYSI